MMLSAAHQRCLRALGDTLLPSIGSDDPRGGDLVPDGVEEILASMAPERVRRVGALLLLFEFAAVARFGRPFSWLDDDRRRRYVAGWMTSRIPQRRIIYRALRSLCMNAYYQNPRAWAAIGYSGPLVRRNEGRAGAAQPRQERS
jgi:hypothetical protein